MANVSDSSLTFNHFLTYFDRGFCLLIFFFILSMTG